MEEFEILSCGIRVLQGDDLFRLGTDSILLSSFALPLRAPKVADLGCGGGALGLLLCAADPNCQITGIELQPRAWEIAKKNIEINQLSHRFQALQGDLRKIERLLPANSFDAVISNPPYFPVGSGAESASEAAVIARTEKFCKLKDICRAARWLLRYGGSFYLVHRPERLADVLYQLKGQHLEPKRLRFVRHHPGAPVSLLLVESRLGGKPGLKLEEDLILFTQNGEASQEYQKIYHII